MVLINPHQSLRDSLPLDGFLLLKLPIPRGRLILRIRTFSPYVRPAKKGFAVDKRNAIFAQDERAFLWIRTFYPGDRSAKKGFAVDKRNISLKVEGIYIVYVPLLPKRCILLQSRFLHRCKRHD